MYATNRDETMTAALALSALSDHHNAIIEEQDFQAALMSQEIGAIALMLRDHKEACGNRDFELANHIILSLYGLVGLQNHSSN